MTTPSNTPRFDSELAKSEARLCALIENSFEGVCVLSGEGVVTYANRSIETVLGYPLHEFIGSTPLEWVHPDDLPGLKLKLANLAEVNGGRLNAEFRIRHRDGGWRNVEAAMLNLLHEDSVAGLACNLRDMSEARQALERERRARAEAEAANSAKDRFLAALSHELRTPLTPVVALLPVLLKTRGITAELRDDLLMIQRNVLLEARLIDDLLDLTRITQGRLQLQLQKADVHELVEHALSISKSEIGAKSLDLDLDLHAQSFYVKADAARLQQVLWNLVKNAVKFTPQKGLIRITTRNPAQHLVQIVVADTGLGIEPEHLPRIFEAFSPSLATTSHRFGGLGLGLSISKAIVEQHGGRIWVTSEGTGKGATFVVELQITQPPAKNETLRIEAPGTVAPPPLRLLVVEDHPNTLEVMARLLRKRGHTVTTASCVADAKAMAEAGSFDVVVSDLGLPDGNGLDLMRHLRDRYGLKGVALSGYGMEEDLRKSREAGFVAHLTKPINLHQLNAALGRIAVTSTPICPDVATTLQPKVIHGSRFPQGQTGK